MDAPEYLPTTGTVTDPKSDRTMSREAFDILQRARDEANAQGLDLSDDDIIRGPSRFEGEHVGILHFYDAAMNGCSDIVYSRECGDGAESVDVDPTEREAFDVDPLHTVAVLSWSSDGFYGLEYGTPADVSALADRMDPPENDDDDTTDPTDDEDARDARRREDMTSDAGDVTRLWALIGLFVGSVVAASEDIAEGFADIRVPVSAWRALRDAATTGRADTKAGG